MDSLIKGGVRIDWSELGEGWSGDYDPDDPNDVELLRFDVFRYIDGEWVEVSDSSYCTQVPVSATPEERAAGLKILMYEFFSPVSSGHSVKKLGERMSWISMEDIDEYLMLEAEGLANE